MRRTRLAIGTLALALAGCSVAPPYQKPELAVPAAYKEADPWQPAGSDVPPAGKWWEAFGDRELSALEARVETGSYTLAAAAAASV